MNGTNNTDGSRLTEGPADHADRTVASRLIQPCTFCNLARKRLNELQAAMVDEINRFKIEIELDSAYIPSENLKISCSACQGRGSVLTQEGMQIWQLFFLQYRDQQEILERIEKAKKEIGF